MLALFCLVLHVLTAARGWEKNSSCNNYTRITHYQAGVWGRGDTAMDVAASQEAYIYLEGLFVLIKLVLK